MRRPLWRTLGWTLLACAALSYAGYRLASDLSQSLGDYSTLGVAAGLFAIGLLLWFGFVALENGILFLHSESIVRAVELRHYPRAVPARRASIADLIWSGIRLVAIAIALNLLALPIYVIAPGVNLVLFALVNGYVLGRAYFDAVALRRLDDRAARLRWRANRGGFVLDGVVCTALLTVPVINLIVPIVGLAAAVHLFERQTSAIEARI